MIPFGSRLAPVDRWDRGALRTPIVPLRSAARTAPGPAGPQRSAALDPSQARQRRRQVLLTLVGLAFVTLLLAVAVGGAMILVNLVFDLLLLVYVVLLVQHKQREQERRGAMLPLYSARSVAPPVAQMPLAQQQEHRRTGT